MILHDPLDEDSGMPRLFSIPSIQEWDLRGFDSERNPILYEGTPYVELHFTLHIRRRTLYYFSNLILPCVIIGRANSSV